ncbi:MAG: hypothetical protein ACLUIO_09185 [Neglectibacter timonensis]
MLVKSITEKEIYDIGHAFGYYDYGQETGMSAAFSGKDATANYICAYVRGVLRSGFLHTTSERGEGYIAYKLPKEKTGPRRWARLRNAVQLHHEAPFQFGIAIKRGGASLQDRMDKEKKPDTQLMQTFRKGRKASLLILCTIIGIRDTDTGINPCFVDIKSTAVKFKNFKRQVTTS